MTGSESDQAPPSDELSPDAWEAMLGGEDGEGEREAAATRTLSQEEIDSLLGFGKGDVPQPQSGLKAIADSSLVSYERLPMLEVVLDRFVRLMTSNLRKFTADHVEVALDDITSVRFGEFLDSIPLPAMIGVVRAVEWDNYGLLTTDSALIYSIVDVLLGGRRGTAPMRIDGRPYTTIERSLMERMIALILADLKDAFAPLTSVAFELERLEVNPRLAAIVRPANAAVQARFSIEMKDRGGRMALLFPYATLEPVRELLLQMFLGERFGRDAIWEAHFAEQLWRADVDLQAVLDTQTLTLEQVRRFRVGTTLPLTLRPDGSISVLCGGVPMLRARIGRVGNTIAVRVDEWAGEGRDKR